jgi:hypothetical protein
MQLTADRYGSNSTLLPRGKLREFRIDGLVAAPDWVREHWQSITIARRCDTLGDRFR